MPSAVRWAKNIDKTFIQSKMLNESKGPAVHSLRAQADKQEYTRSMRRVLENTDHLTIRQAEIAESSRRKSRASMEPLRGSMRGSRRAVIR